MWTSYAVILTLPIIGVIYVTVLRYKQFHCFWVLNFQTKLWSKKSNTKNNKIQNTKKQHKTGDTPIVWYTEIAWHTAAY